TGRPPYVAGDPDAVRLMAVRGQLGECFDRLNRCGGDTELIALAKRCLAAERDARPRNAGEVEVALSAYLAGGENRAHLAEVERAAADARATEEANTRREAEAKTVEERKRRRVQLALAASVGLLLIGGGAVGWWQDRQGTERRAETASRAKNNAAAIADLLGRCEQALRDDDTNRAAVALAEVERRLADGGGEA